MTTEINVYYFEHNCIIIRIPLFQNFVSPPSISMHCWILRVYKSTYKFVTHTLSYDT